MNNLQKITVYLFKKYNVLCQLDPKTLTYIARPITIQESPLYYINWLRTFPSNIEIQNKIYNDFKTIIVILYINYLKEKNIYNNFINCLKTTTCSHHCNEIDTYVKKFIEDDIILDFIASAFIFDSTPLGWNFWHKHYENAIVYVNSFLYSA